MGGPSSLYYRGWLGVPYHDHDVVEHVGEPAQVCRPGAGGIVPGEEGGGGSEGEGGSFGLLAELLEEREEVGGVVVVDGVAPEALSVRILITVGVVSIMGDVVGCCLAGTVTGLAYTYSKSSPSS